MGGQSVIVIDTHIWVWWVHDLPELEPWMRKILTNQQDQSVLVSAISCWEIARLVAGGRLDLGRPILDWFAAAFNNPGVVLTELTPTIAVDSNNLPGNFHKDPADRIIVATARVLGCPLLTADAKIRSYPDVMISSPNP